MKAFTRSKYGGPEVLTLEEVETPVVGETDILVKVFANSANPADWHLLRGKPFFARFVTGFPKPKIKTPGADFAGMVMDAGPLVKRFRPGDFVFGETLKGGAFAEFACVPAGVCAIMPEKLPFTIMASLPVAGLTALQALITHGKLQAGEKVLINGGSGGVGHFAVQIAKAYGANVTAVCSSRNVDFVKNLGADQVIAYDKENIHRHKGRYHLVIDAHGNLNYKDFVRMGARGVVVGFTTMRHMGSLLLRKALGSFPLVQFTAVANAKDLDTLAVLVLEGKLVPNIEKSYRYMDIPAAIGHIENMRTRGKVVMDWSDL